MLPSSTDISPHIHSNNVVLPVYITGYEFISMLCDMERDDPEPEDIFDRIGFSVAKRDELIADYTFEEKKLLQLACILVIRLAYPHLSSWKSLEVLLR